MFKEPVAKLHDSGKSKILSPIAEERRSLSERADGGLPERVGEEARTQSGSKGRFYASKSFATGSKAFFLTFSLIGYSSEPLDVAKISEAMGHMIGKNLEELGLDFDLDAIVKGLKEESEGKNSPMNEDECVQAIAILQEEKMSRTAEQELEQADAVSNGDQVTDEDHPLPTADSAKYR